MNIAFFSAAAYDAVDRGRTRIIADELARRHRVHFIDLPSLRHPGACGSSAASNGVVRYHVPPLPLFWRSFDTAVGELWVRRVVRFLQSQLPPDTRAVVSTPFWAPVLRKLGIHSLTYECLDHGSMGCFGAPEAVVDRLENNLAMNARQIVCASRKIARLWNNRTAKPLHVISNGFPADFPTRPFKRPERPAAGFCGPACGCFDAALVAECARALPDVRFVLSGPARRGWHMLRLSALSNVEIGPQPPPGRVADEIERYTVGMIPFVQNDISFFGDPLQLYGYLALGRPVVSTVDNGGGLPVRVAEDAGDFIAALEKALYAPADAAALREAVSGRSWEEIAARMENILE